LKYRVFCVISQLLLLKPLGGFTVSQGNKYQIIASNLSKQHRGLLRKTMIGKSL